MDEIVVCDAYAKVKHVRSYFNPKKMLSTTNSLQLMHMDRYGSMKFLKRGGKRYVFFIINDYPRFTWTVLLISKDETFNVLSLC